LEKPELGLAQIVFSHGDCMVMVFPPPAKPQADEADHCITLQEPLHGREILCCLSLFSGRILITGSEDTLLRVIDNTGHMKVL